MAEKLSDQFAKLFAARDAEETRLREELAEARKRSDRTHDWYEHQLARATAAESALAEARGALRGLIGFYGQVDKHGLPRASENKLLGNARAALARAGEQETPRARDGKAARARTLIAQLLGVVELAECENCDTPYGEEGGCVECAGVRAAVVEARESMKDPLPEKQLSGSAEPASFNKTAADASILKGEPASSGQDVPMRNGVSLIAAERARQVAQEGWTPEHDDEHAAGELAVAAACYSLPEAMRVLKSPLKPWPSVWPWDPSWWKPGDRVRELVKAGALIAAEIDRLQRAAPASTTPPPGEQGKGADALTRLRAERDRYNETEGESGEMPLLEALDAFLDAKPEQGEGGWEGRVLGERARGMARLTGELAEALELARQHFDSVEGYVSSLRSIADAVLAEHPAPAQPAEHPAVCKHGIRAPWECKDCLYEGEHPASGREETRERMEARHREANRRLGAQALEDSVWDEPTSTPTPGAGEQEEGT